MATYYPIMDDIDISRLIKVRVSISLHFLSASRPSSMAYPNMGLRNLLTNLLYKSINAVHSLVRLLRMLDHLLLDMTILLAESYNPSTVIATIFQKFDSHG